MADIVDPETRSRMMSGIRGKNTKPELLIRKGLHRLGFRYRLHVKDLTGKPDLVLPKYKAVIFVHGCFWHGHDCHLFKWPSTRPGFWKEKIAKNRQRDAKTIETLQKSDWRILCIWECSLKGKRRFEMDEILSETALWLKGTTARGEIRGRQK